MKNLILAAAVLSAILFAFNSAHALQGEAAGGTAVDCNIDPTSDLANHLISDWYSIQHQASTVTLKVIPSSDINSAETYTIKVEATDVNGRMLKSKELKRVQVTKLNDSMAISYAGRSLVHPPFLLIVDTSMRTSEGRLKFHDYHYGNRIGHVLSCSISHI